MTLYRITLTLAVSGPLLARASDIPPVGVDVTGLQFNGEYVLPGTHIRGQLLHALRDVDALTDNAMPLSTWFGGEHDDPNPGRAAWQFAHFFTIRGKSEPGRHELIRIQLDADGNVEKNQLVLVQSAFGYGAPLCVTGWIDGRFSTDAEAEAAAKTVAKALEWAGALGSEKSVGFGRISAVSTVVERAPERVVHPIDTGALTATDSWMLSLEFDRPLCFAQSQGPLQNRFYSVSHIPGAAVVAQIAEARVLDADALNALSVSNAYLSPRCQSAAIPMSYCKAELGGVDHYMDAAGQGGPFVIAGSDQRAVPTFVCDWKHRHRSRVRDLAQLPADVSPDWLEVRTAIEQGGRNVAEQQLFSYFCVSHIDDNATPRRWHARLHVGHLSTTEREALAAFLHRSMRGPFGKTDALLTSVQLVADVPPKWRLDGAVSVYLHSDACLLPDVTETGDTDAYAHYWHDVSGGTLRLERAFARERLAGGAYVHQRFKTNSAYRPDRLTEVGSVFRLAVVDPDRAGELLDSWSACGIPDAARYRDQPWQYRPWSPCNGYGRIGQVPALASLPSDLRCEGV